VFKATDGLITEFGEARVLDMPLAESAIVGVGIGAALHGLRPIAEIQFADFIHPAFDQIVSEAARIHYRSNGDFCVPMVIRAPYGGGVHGALYHSQSVESLFAHVPGLKVVCPSTPADLKGLLLEALDDPDPVLFLEHKKAYRSVKGPVPEGDWRVPIGVAAVARPGTDATIVTYGLQRHLAVEAAETLAAEGAGEIEVLDLRTISPLDREAILASARKTGRVLVVSEDNYSFSVAAEVAALVGEQAFYDLDAPVMRLATADVPAMPYAPTLEAAVLITTERITEAARRLLRA
jgi:2-oxoisovalerate dehydrogenase E1 component beta subunit